MTVRWCVVFCALLLIANLNVNEAKRFGGGSHSYPRSGGLSGHGSSYGGSHSYPSSNRGGLSGGSHGYPSSGGLSGNGRSPGAHTYPSSGSNHGYPSSGGSHGYPSSGGLSGNNNAPSKVNTHTTHTTNVYNNYHYSPPQQIRYTPTHGAPMNYPVYQGRPPTYVYQYKDSGSKYGTLLAGLALLNLGALATTAYAVSHNSHNSYKPQPGEVCKFGVRKENNDYEETRIDCQLITSFILQDQEKSQNGGGGTNTTVVTTTVTNVTMVNNTNGEPAPATSTEPPVAGNVIYTMLPNGTLVPLNATFVNGTIVNGVVNDTTTSTEAPPPANGGSSSVTITTTTTNTTVTNALDVKGKPVEVTPGMTCYVIRTTRTSNMRKSVPCGLLQTYADRSIKTNSASRNAMSLITVLAVVSAMLIAY